MQEKKADWGGDGWHSTDVENENRNLPDWRETPDFPDNGAWVLRWGSSSETESLQATEKGARKKGKAGKGRVSQPHLTYGGVRKQPRGHC